MILTAWDLRADFRLRTSLPDIGASTASAGTMMGRFGVERKVRCHKGAVEIVLWWRKSSDAPSASGGAFSSYLQSTLLSCEAATCHLPLRFSQVSVQTWHCFASGCVLSLPMACSLP